MIDELRARPDITLAVDGEGVIRTAVSAERLASEMLDPWRGLPWKDTVTPELAKQVAKSVADASNKAGSACFTINQRFPSGREFLIEYTTVNLGKKGGFVAIGKSLEPISELQLRLALVQQEREQGYWKLREIETRYRALLEASTEAVALVRVTNLRVVEANAAATKTLGLFPGSEFYLDLPDRDRRALADMLEAVRMRGRAPSMVLHLSSGDPWSLRGSMINGETGAFYLFQMAPLLGSADPRSLHEVGGATEQFSVEDFVRRMPEGFAIVDHQGLLTHANATFLDLVQVDVESAAIGQNVKRWLSRPGAGIKTILDLVERHGSVRALKTTLEGELGASTEIEITAAGDRDGRPNALGLVVRDATLRGPGAQAAPFEPDLTGTPCNAPLEDIVRHSVETIERRQIVDALAETGGNRTLAAKRLKLSRQSLHAKLKKYGLGNK
jgi:transcriptional regulator PpsR